MIFQKFSARMYSVIGIALIVIMFFQANDVLATRPFWADKNSYIEGDFLYVVSVVSNTDTIDDGKQQALVHGKLELMNVAKISEIAAAGLALEARHTYVDHNTDGTVTVYQLQRIPASEVVEVQRRLRDEAEIQKQAFEEAHRELVEIQKSLNHQKQELENQTLSAQEALISIKEIQDSLKAQAEQMDRGQSEIDHFKSILKENVTTLESQKNEVDELLPEWQSVNQAQLATLKRLQDMEQEFQEADEETKRLHQSIVERIEKVSLKACEFISRGMTPSEVKNILGPPSGEKQKYKDERYDTWAYGTVKVNFDAQAVVESVKGC